MADNVDDLPVWIAHEETAHAPRFIGYGIDNLEAAGKHLGMNHIDIGHLNRYIGMKKGEDGEQVNATLSDHSLPLERRPLARSMMLRAWGTPRSVAAPR